MVGVRKKRFGVHLTRLAAALAAVTVIVSGAVVGGPQGMAAAAAAGTGSGTVQTVEEAGIAKSADLSKFQPGHIISDAVFFNKGTMTEAQIQTFLEQRVPRCDAGYTCLKDWYDTSRTTSADAMCGAYSGGVRERASRIIYKVAQACGINPQVILVTLQKEQGLVTHNWPSEWRYTIAMGQGCPDTAACDTRYYGFFNQVYGAAWQMKRYANPPGTSQYFTWYAPGRTWNVLYNPNRNCGSSPVYIQNQATANLYYYTPYQPNAAALRAGYGEGDGCSSYGNRNFFNYFTDWFGSTQTPANACAEPGASSVAAASGLYVTNTDAVNARRAPSTSCDDGVRTLASETLLVRTGTYAEWSRVSVDGVTSWIRSDLLTSLSSTAAPALALDDTNHIFALTSTGNVLAYPFSKVGRWGTAVTLLEGQGLSQLVAVGDVDQDGHRDLVGLDSQSRAVLHRGDGVRLADPEVLAVDWSSARLVTGAGDFDGDGNPDVFLVTHKGELQLWRGDGKGSFHPPAVIGNGWGAMTSITGGSDLSGDGIPDLMARSSAGTLHLYRGDGRGSWAGSAQIGRGWSSVTALVAPGDFTGDGKPDLLSRDGDGALHLYRGTGTAVAYMAQVGTSWGGMRSIVGPGIPVEAPAPRTSGPGAGDINNDGYTDLVAVADGGLLLYRGDGKGGWLGSGVLDGSWPAGARLVAMADFNGDGVRDLGRIGTDGTFSLLPGTDGTTLGPPVSIGVRWGALTSVFGAIDFDADGNVDVMARDSSGRLILYRGDGKGGWAGSSVVGNGWSGFDHLVPVGDFDGDGFDDLLARRSDGTLWLYPTSGAGGWKKARQIGRGWGGFTALAGPGNFDGAGGPDVLARTASGELMLYRGDGDGGWSGSVRIGRGWSSMSQIL